MRAAFVGPRRNWSAVSVGLAVGRGASTANAPEGFPARRGLAPGDRSDRMPLALSVRERNPFREGNGLATWTTALRNFVFVRAALSPAGLTRLIGYLSQW